jgi:hypothetical protein
MPEADSPLRLGIIGGCLSHQHDIGLGELYHRRLADMVAASSGRRLRVRIARSFELGHEDRLERLLDRGELDVVMLHMRATIVTRAALLVRVWSGGQSSFRLNPALLDRRHHRPPAVGNEELQFLADQTAEAAARGSDLDTPDAYNGSQPRQDAPPAGRRLAGFRLRDLNHALGKLLGLYAWAIDDELSGLDGFLHASRKRGVAVLVMGPTPATFGGWQSGLIRRYSETLQTRLGAKGIPFARVDVTTGPSGRIVTRADGLHLTAEGHELVAAELYRAGQPYWPAPPGPEPPG